MHCYEYPRPAVATDIVVFNVMYKMPRVLLIKRRNPPYQNKWALPGGFMNMDEKLIDTAFRELYEETNLKPDKLTFLGIYDDINRDPRGRTLGVAYIAIIDQDVKPIAGDDASDYQWFSVNELPALAFDHNIIIADALQKLSTML